MQRVKSFAITANALAFALCAIMSPVGGQEEKRPPIALKAGEEVPVDLRGARDAVAILEPSEKPEFFRDVLLISAFASFPSSPEHRHDFLAVCGALRRPHLDPLAPGEVGRGRYAALSKDAGLLLVPFDDAGKSFDPTTTYRLLDKQMCLEGTLPPNLHVIAYRLDSAKADVPRASLTRLDTIQSKLFYTDGKHGYAEAEIGEAADLGKLLEKIDDVLAVRVKDKKLVVAGRKYPDETYKAKIRDRITLDDLKVLWAAFHDTKAAEAKMAAKIKEQFKDENLPNKLLAKMVKDQLEAVGNKGSELGFSLDPWIDLEKLQQLMAEVLMGKELRNAIPAPHLKRLEECKTRLDAILKEHSEQPDADKKSPVMEVPSSKADDRTGLFVFKDEVSLQLVEFPNDTKLKQFAELLEVITHESQFVRARYDGVLPGTPVAMTMYYCDLIAKAYAFGQVNVKPLLDDSRIERIVGLPRVEGFQPWPQIRLGGQYWGEIRKAKSLRLWWSADPNGFRWDKQGGETRIAFCPQAVRISFRNKIGEIAQEEEPDPLRALFRDRWNRHYLDIADHDCAFHHFNQIYKWAILVKLLKELDQSGTLELVAGKPDRTDLRFDKWYSDAVRQKKVGFSVKFDFSKRFKGVPEETMGFVHSGAYIEAGRVAGWTGGGDLGPTKGDVESAKRAIVPNRVPGVEVLLPSGRMIVVPGKGRERVVVVPAHSAKLDSPSVRLLLPRARLESELVVRPGDATLQNWLNDGTNVIDVSRLTTKMVEGRVVVALTSGTHDLAYKITRDIIANRDLDSRRVTEVRYSETGDRMLLRLAGEKGAKPIWLEVLPGGFGGGKKPPRDAVAVGSPGEPGWCYTIVRPEVTDDELARFRPSNGKGFIRVELTGSTFNPYHLGADWFPNPFGLPKPASLFGKGVTGDEMKTALLNASADENRCASLLFVAIADPARSKRLADVARIGLQKDLHDEAFDHFTRMIDRGATPLEIRIGSGNNRLTVTRQGDIYAVNRGAESDSLLPGDSPFRYVVTEPKTSSVHGVRVVDRTLILPENATDTHLKTAREVVDFLSKHPDLIAVASNVSGLNNEVLFKLKMNTELIAKVATSEFVDKLFPWPKGEFLIHDTRTGRVAVSVDRMGKISTSIREVCDAWLKEKDRLLANASQLEPVQSAAVEMLSRGIDREQLALLGEYLYLLKLRQADRPKEIINNFNRIKQNDQLRIERAQQDKLGNGQPFTKESLRCTIRLLHADAASEVYRKDPKQLIPVVTDVLENWPILKSYSELVGDPRSVLLAALGSQRPELIDLLHLKGDYWKHTAALAEIDGLAGAAITGDSLQLYLRANESVYTVAVSHDNRATLLKPEEATNARNEISKKEMAENSTSVMRLFQVSPDGDGFSLRFSDGANVRLSQTDYVTLTAGKKLPNEHPLSTALKGLKEDCLTLYAHPLMRKPGPEMSAAKDVAFALQKAYPEMKIHRDPLSPTTSERAKALNEKKLNGLDDLLVIVSGKSFKVKHDVVQNIGKSLATLGIKPVEFTEKKYTGPTGRTVIVISGHTSKELANYVRELGDAGYFKDNYVIFNSCESELTEQLMAELTSRYGAAAAVGFEKKIDVDKVEKYVLGFVKKLKDKGGQGLFRLLLDTLRENGLNAIWNLCRLDGRSVFFC